MIKGGMDEGGSRGRACGKFCKKDTKILYFCLLLAHFVLIFSHGILWFTRRKLVSAIQVHLTAESSMN